MKKEKYLLPGLDLQLKFIKQRLNIENFSIAIYGSNTVNVAEKLLEGSNSIDIIVEDYESLMISKLALGKKENIKIKLMDFERTDFNNESIDLVYAQGAFTDFRRKTIVKEAKRILKHEGYLCVGEVVKLKDDIPPFVADIFDESSILPLSKNEFPKYYENRNFSLIDTVDLTDTLQKYYSLNLKLLDKNKNSLTAQEKSYYKKVLNKISHESKVYLKLGGDKYIGFVTSLFKKN
ncbi:MAG: hypothetical protein CR986_02520 [Ignavibacteriae bacterium]|nr:MAG: hypothetical protein CR986_02520 [Ignavibacteriota bacterium]